MKLSRLYCNRPEIFATVDFTSGLNVVLAEIRLPENRNKDTHNLGKTTLGRLLDFCFLARVKANHFLVKHKKVFEPLVFFLEIEIDGTAGRSFVTVRRSVAEPTKICFKCHDQHHDPSSVVQTASIGKVSDRGFVDLALDYWDHQDVPIDRAQLLLDGLLNWRALAPWSYRKVMGYLVRSQEDFRDVFQLRKFSGKHADWKPFLAHLLGFNAELVSEHYALTHGLEEAQKVAHTLSHELGGAPEDVSKIDGILLLKHKEAEKKQALLDAFDFRVPDKERTQQLVEEINTSIASLNQQRYSLTQNRQKVLASLQEDEILFDPDQAHQLFAEAGVLFEGQIKKDFEQLIAFNHAITAERRGYLQQELAELDASLETVNAELNVLGKRRSEVLAFLGQTDVFEKYKHLSEEMVRLGADILVLQRQRTELQRLQQLRHEIRTLSDQCAHLQADIEADVQKHNADPEGLFSSIRVFFSEIVEEVIDRKALLSVSVNTKGHLDFRVEILDESGNATSADNGHTYRKLLCVAFDLAVLRAHFGVGFPRFVYHDGVFESLDDRKKQNLLAVIRRYAAMGLQPIITVIDSDLPASATSYTPQPPASEPPRQSQTESSSESGPLSEFGFFTDDEIVLKLNDEGEQGRLFKMAGW